jgi:hypothetical protein
MRVTVKGGDLGSGSVGAASWGGAAGTLWMIEPARGGNMGLVLALAAGATGLTVTWWSLQALTTLVPDGLPRVESVRMDALVI